MCTDYENETSAVARLQTLLASLQKEAQQLPTEVDSLKQRLAAATSNTDSQQKRQCRRHLRLLHGAHTASDAFLHPLFLTAALPFLSVSGPELSETERRCEDELAAVQKQLVPFQQALGLAFIPKSSQRSRLPHLSRLPYPLLCSPYPCCVSRADELQVVFTRISRALPSRPFTLSVFVNAANDYEVQSCSPPIATLPALLAELNDAHNGDFAVFLFKVRKEFQRIAGTD